MSTKKFAVKVPITGYSIVLIEADTLDDAMKVVQMPGFSLEDEDNEPTCESVQMVAHLFHKPEAPNENQITIATTVFGSVDN